MSIPCQPANTDFKSTPLRKLAPGEWDQVAAFERRRVAAKYGLPSDYFEAMAARNQRKNEGKMTLWDKIYFIFND